jgi:hypothetical protein
MVDEVLKLLNGLILGGLAEKPCDGLSDGLRCLASGGESRNILLKGNFLIFELNALFLGIVKSFALLFRQVSTLPAFFVGEICQYLATLKTILAANLHMVLRMKIA